MSTLLTTSKTGSNLRRSFPSWVEDWLGNDLAGTFGSNFNTGMTLPAVNIRETGDEYLVEMAVPGLQKSDFDISLEDHVLSISAEVDEKEESKQGNYTRREFGYASFKRSFSLPETVEDEQIKAEYKEGVLSIHLPKKEEARKKPVRSIKIS
ncbi:Hsp20/alpha crystallin family protein [Flagellimonas lutaonensis]|uniref:Small heat shock protein n=1 Tax=Flagellimonas lutaonensis TaxID=516051 RepID=A0A0D5YSX4_9FLAO|nr:Hsp20/alpha crystallin family protein [Allomuricauda lutaonensis]AKA35004.1 Small heat shock protein [Allomuricauda lutaonensis]